MSKLKIAIGIGDFYNLFHIVGAFCKTPLRNPKISILALVILVSSCTSEKDQGPDLAKVNLEVPVTRIDTRQIAASQELKGAEDITSYLNVYEKYLKDVSKPVYYLSGIDMIDLKRERARAQPLSQGQRDSAIAFQMGRLLADSAFGLLTSAVAERFPADMDFRERFEPVLKRYHYYFPEVPVPALYTHINGYDPSGHPNAIDQFFPGDGFISVGLHYFMGENFEYYSPNIPRYIKRRFEPAYMDVTFAHELANGTAPELDPRNQTSVLEAMIQQGMKYYLIEKLLPQAPDSMIMLYASEEIAWADKWEAKLFRDVALNMFESDMVYKRKLLGENAFTSEYSGNSAPRIGGYLGWRIVQSYMRRNSDVTLLDLVKMNDFEKIYRESGYKP